MNYHMRSPKALVDEIGRVRAIMQASEDARRANGITISDLEYLSGVADGLMWMLKQETYKAPTSKFIKAGEEYRPEWNGHSPPTPR